METIAGVIVVIGRRGDSREVLVAVTPGVAMYAEFVVSFDGIRREFRCGGKGCRCGFLMVRPVVEVVKMAREV